MKNSNSQIKANLVIRSATIKDLPGIIKLLADDPFGKIRENISLPPAQNYIDAIHEIIQDKNVELLVIDNTNDVVGVAQINYLRYLTYQGGLRAQIEGVRINKNYRSQGLGKKLFEHLIALAKSRGCHVVQLTTDKERPDALKFYENLGFKQSHIGLKLHFGETGRAESD